MDQTVLLKQLVRQVKILNVWVSIFGTLFLLTLAICGFLIFKMVTFVQTSTQKISDIQAKTSQTLNLQNDICGNTTITGFLGTKAADYCK